MVHVDVASRRDPSAARFVFVFFLLKPELEHALIVLALYFDVFIRANDYICALFCYELIFEHCDKFAPQISHVLVRPLFILSPEV